ncbi:MAG: TonB-dependent receptor [Myxococcota bacterium]
MKPSLKALIFALLAALLASPLAFTAAGAEDLAAPGEQALSSSKGVMSKPPEGFEVISVKGREVSALESEVPTSVTQFTAANIEALGAQNIADVSAVTPNVEIRTAGATSPTFFIRGVGLSDFSANAAGAVAIYRDDVPINAPAMQLGLLYDLEDVQILRGPIGTGSGRNASAGAIKVFSRKPSGNFGASLRSTYGNYNYLNFEGAIEAPLIEEVLATRLAFRTSQRDPYGRNGCAGAPKNLADRLPQVTAPNTFPVVQGPKFCAEQLDAFSNPIGGGIVPGQPPTVFLSPVPAGLPSRVNDLGRWAARGQLLFQPRDLEMSWLLGANGYKVNEFSKLGQAIGAIPAFGGNAGGSLGTPYIDPDILEERDRLVAETGLPVRTVIEDILGPILASKRPMDTRPHRGDYDRVGMTRLSVWGASLRGDMTFGNVDVTTITGFDGYDRYRDTDQDFTPDVVFESVAQDTAWQFSQEVRSEIQLESAPVALEAGGFFLMQKLKSHNENFQPRSVLIAASEREYREDLYSFGVFGRFAWDFLDDFTLEGGVRYNWEQKSIDFQLVRGACTPANCAANAARTWQAPTGELNLVYTFPDADVQLVWKYARGWKGGQFNAASSLNSGTQPITYAEPESIDDFELKLAGKWFDQRVILNASLFFYKYENYQVFLIQSKPVDPPELVIVNANDAQVYGAELSLITMPLRGLVEEEFEGFRFEARFGWLESEFLDFVNPVLKTVFKNDLAVYRYQIPVNYTGNSLINSPNFKLSLTATWAFDLGRWGTITPRYDGAWSSAISFNQANGLRTANVPIPGTPPPFEFPKCAVGQCAFWIHNLRLTYASPDGNIEISGWVRNIENTVYRTFAFDASEFAGLTINYVSEPRFYGVDFRVKW